MYVRERSNESESYFFFAYRVRISNGGKEAAQLVGRHWVITDGNGKTQEVRGPGVVGEHPFLREGESFEYTSFCPLPTPVGTMHGSYEFIGTDEEPFDAQIAPFTLAVPGQLN